MGRTYRDDYDISLHAVERYVERVEGGRAPSITQQRQIDAVRWNIQRDLELAHALSPAAVLVCISRGLLEPNVKALVSDTRIYLVKGRKVLTMYEVDSATLALADELAEQSAENGGFISPSGGYCPETLTCPSQDDAVRGLGSLTIPRHVLEVLAEAWGCMPSHKSFASALARLRRCAQRINPSLFRKDTFTEPDVTWICFRHKDLRFAVVDETMVACIHI